MFYITAMSKKIELTQIFDAIENRRTETIKVFNTFDSCCKKKKCCKKYKKNGKHCGGCPKC